MILIPLAMATTGFDPASPAEVYTGTEVEDLEGSVRLWSAIELHEDPDRTLFGEGEFNDVTAWPRDASWAPYIADCFQSETPHTSKFLLHVGPSAAIASGTPVLFVPGAADNGSRGFITMAWHEDLLGKPVYAMTFAHPHGDAFQQAEQVADAIARIKERTGAAQVDVVAHSKGGISAAIYASNGGVAGWGEGSTGAAYERVGTPYQGDIRRLVLIATPLKGIDTAFRWSTGNFLSLDAESTFSPSAWEEYYPYGTGTSWVSEDLRAQDFYAEEGDLFPGHRQIYARQDHPLPGSLTWLGPYAYQQDWYSTYEGGYGYYTYSDGIDGVVDAGGGVLAALQQNGVDPAVELFLLAGENPLMPNGYEDWAATQFGESWAEFGKAERETWADVIASAVGEGIMSEELTEEELQGVLSGDLVIGEISGQSDGLVFLDSANDENMLTSRGAVVIESHIANLSHLDLLYASPITGELLIEAGAADDDDAWMISFGERYAAEDTIGLVESWLADGDDGSGGDEGEVGDEDPVDSGLVDSGTPADPDTDEGQDVDEPGTLPEECGACNGGHVAPGLLGVVAGLIGVRRRGASRR